MGILSTTGANPMTQVNYTPEMESKLLENVPFDYERAKELAAEMGKHPKSIVAKVKRMENDEALREANPNLPEVFYNAKPAYQTKQGLDVEKKADIVAQISAMLGVACASLEKAGKADLQRVRDALVSIAPESN